jgi:transcriptional regulator with XRE-family HTH domain/tetratricopeptide (TPR) repeat protein
MLDDLEGRRTGERIQVLRERKGLSRRVLAELVGMSESWLKGIERGTRLAPRLPKLVKLAEALGIGDVAVLAGTDMELTNGVSIPMASFSHIPHIAAPAIREAIWSPMLRPPAGMTEIAALRRRVDDAWRIWHGSITHRTDVGRILPTLVSDARGAARLAQSDERRAANALLVDVYALVQHELVWASETEIMAVVADRGMAAAQEADRPLPLAGAAWTLAMVQRSRGDNEGALDLIKEAGELLRPELEGGSPKLQSMYGALLLNGALTSARARREGDALRYLDEGDAVAERLPTGYHHPWTQFGVSNVAVHSVSIRADLSKSVTALEQAQQIDPETIPSRERRARLHVEVARTYHQRRDHSAALTWLQRAYAICNDSVHYSPGAREMVSNIVDKGGPMTDREAHSFAQLISLPA